MTIDTTVHGTKRIWVYHNEIQNHPNKHGIIGALNALSIWGGFDKYEIANFYSWEVEFDIPDAVLERFVNNLKK